MSSKPASKKPTSATRSATANARSASPLVSGKHPTLKKAESMKRKAPVRCPSVTSSATHDSPSVGPSTPSISPVSSATHKVAMPQSPPPVTPPPMGVAASPIMASERYMAMSGSFGAPLPPPASSFSEPVRRSGPLRFGNGKECEDEAPRKSQAPPAKRDAPPGLPPSPKSLPVRQMSIDMPRLRSEDEIHVDASVRSLSLKSDKEFVVAEETRRRLGCWAQLAKANAAEAEAKRKRQAIEAKRREALAQAHSVQKRNEKLKRDAANAAKAKLGLDGILEETNPTNNSAENSADCTSGGGSTVFTADDIDEVRSQGDEDEDAEKRMKDVAEDSAAGGSPKEGSSSSGKKGTPTGPPKKTLPKPTSFHSQLRFMEKEFSPMSIRKEDFM